MKILIIEDEYSLADTVAEALKRENFDVTIITNGEDGEDEALTNVYDLILLDVMLPKKNGFEILKTIKQEKIDSPVILLTAKSEIDDKLNGLENGADDYVTKPFHLKELIARVKVVLKRNANIEDTNILEFGDLKLDLTNGEMICDNQKIQISGKELNLLELLMLNKSQVIDKEVIADKIWGFNSDAEYNTAEVYISFLRKKLKLLKSKVKIKTVRSIGYKLEIEND